MSDLQLLLLIAGMAGATILTRLGPTLLAAKFQPSPTVSRWLEQVPSAVMAAIVVPVLVTPEGELDLGLGNQALSVGLATAAFAHLSKNFALTVVFGVATTATLRLLLA